MRQFHILCLQQYNFLYAFTSNLFSPFQKKKKERKMVVVPSAPPIFLRILQCNRIFFYVLSILFTIQSQLFLLTFFVVGGVWLRIFAQLLLYGLQGGGEELIGCRLGREE